MNVFGLPAHDDREALANFIEGLKVAESAAKQMAFYTSRTEWLKVRFAIEGVRETATALAQASLRKVLM